MDSCIIFYKSKNILKSLVGIDPYYIIPFCTVALYYFNFGVNSGNFFFYKFFKRDLLLRKINIHSFQD